MKTDLNIIFEDNHLLIINKPAGLLVQGDKTGDDSLLDKGKAYIKEKYNKPGKVYLGLPHRLDRPTSGIVVLAKTSKALERLNKMFQDRSIEKTYWAIVKNNPKEIEATLSGFMYKNQEKNRSYVHAKPKKGGQLAELSYKLIGKSKFYNLLEVKPKTGRHHQIRVQLASIGCPITGDIKYGFKRSNPDRSIHLHAKALVFVHPVSKETMKINAKPPKEQVWDFFKEI
jgi:23S rRNA pseudouridine1911/1915/1917 synthase